MGFVQIELAWFYLHFPSRIEDINGDGFNPALPGPIDYTDFWY